MKLLGLRLGEHDSNITYYDGSNVKYFKPERHNQIKHFAYNDIFSWLESSNILNFNLNEIDAIGVVLDTYQFSWLEKDDPNKLYTNIDIPFEPFTSLKCPIFKIDHHYAHSLSSWMLTESSSTDFVLDGYGDLYRSCSVFSNNKIQKCFTLDEMFSFGKHLAEECAGTLNVKGMGVDLAGKVMALQSFGKLNKEFNNHISQFPLEDSKRIFDINPFIKAVGSKIASKHNFLDYVRTIHDRMERAFPEFFKKYAQPQDLITYSGGIALNVCINTQLKKQFSNLIIPPHCADEGLSLGCVEFLRQHFDQPKFKRDNFPFWQSDVAPMDNPSDKTIRETAEELAKGKIVGWYQGHGEIGPRALGNRSILMSPEVKNGKSIINEKVKHREDYRPFAASVKLDKVSEFFDWKGESEFMLYSVKFKDKIFAPISHVDKTCRIQTVKPSQHYYYELLNEFEKLTGLPMLLNTSLNDNGKPIAGKAEDAIALLKSSELDLLVVGNKVLTK
jgi:carbamoyltransferase